MEWPLLGWLALLLYVGAEGLSVVSLVRSPNRLGRLVPLLIVGGLICQFLALNARARLIGAVPYRSLGGSMSLFGWMLGLAYLALLLRHRERAIGPFLIPLVVLFSAAGLIVAPAASTPSSETRGSLFAFHVTLAILAYAAFTFSFVLSVLYLVQNRQIRSHRTGVLFARLPPLEAIGRMNRTSVAIGLFSLAVSVALGAVWAGRVWQSLPDAKLGVALCTLVLYAFLLWMDRRGWKGQRVAVLSIVGFGLVLFSYTVVNLFLSPEHVFR
jgi:ABC-type uncharacterized transport system permease subunit